MMNEPQQKPRTTSRQGAARQHGYSVSASRRYASGPKEGTVQQQVVLKLLLLKPTAPVSIIGRIRSNQVRSTLLHCVALPRSPCPSVTAASCPASCLSSIAPQTASPLAPSRPCCSALCCAVPAALLHTTMRTTRHRLTGQLCWR